MKKNVIIVFLDSFWYGYLNNNSLGEPVMPFLDSLSDKAFIVKNSFSPGPYTEAALRGVMSSIKTLDHMGYDLFLGQEDSNYIDFFYNNGYEIYDSIYPYYLWSYETMKKIHNPLYVSGMMFKSLWDSKKSFFIEAFENGRWNQIYENKLERLLRAYFSSWADFLREYSKNKRAYMCLKKQIKHYDFNHNYYLLNKEKDEFELDPKAYMQRLLIEKDEFSLWKIRDINYQEGVNYDEINNQLSARLRLKLKYMQFRATIQSDININKAILCIIESAKTGDKSRRRYAGSLKMMLEKVKDFDVYKKRWPISYNSSSLGKQLEVMYENLSNRHQDSPFFYNIKSEDMHYFHTYCSFDCENQKIKTEFTDLNQFIDNIDVTKCKGCISGFLSAHYVDGCIKQLFEYLEKEKLLDKTLVAIASDHGSSFAATPIRENQIMNFYDENYRTPFIIYDSENVKDRESVANENLYMTYSMLPTIADLCCLVPSYEMAGKSVRDPCARQDIVIIEHMGPGYPDLGSRDIWFCARDKKYSFAYKVRLMGMFSDGIVESIYDIENDPKQLINLVEVGTILEQTQYLRDAIKVRWNELRKEYP